jgi:hypothetical protein
MTRCERCRTSQTGLRSTRVAAVFTDDPAFQSANDKIMAE